MIKLEMNSVFDLILSLQKCKTISFPQHVVNELGSYFPNSTIAFHPGSLYDLLSSRKGLSMNMPKYLLPVIVNLKKHRQNNMLQEYMEHYYLTDVKQPPNLPQKLRGKTLLQFSDIMTADEFKRTEMYFYLNSCDLINNATIYLYDNNVCLGGIAFLRSQEMGEYTMKELAIMEFIGKYISQLYVTSLKESFYTGISDIYRKNQDAEYIGMAIITSKFDVIEANNVITEFCDHILQESPDFSGISNQMTSSLSLVARTIALCTCDSNTVINREVHIGRISYNCTLRPVIMRPLSMDIWSLYVFQIHKVDSKNFFIADTLAKQYVLTNRERDIAELITKGYSTEQISKELFISPNTVKNHVSNLFRKVEVSNRIELINKLTSTSNNLPR